MPYSFDYVGFSERIKQEVSDPGLPRGKLNGENVSRIINQIVGTGCTFSSTRVSEAKLQKKQQISFEMMNYWSQFFAWRYSDPDWTVVRFVREFGVEGFEIEGTRLDEIEADLSEVKTAIAEMQEAIARLAKHIENSRETDPGTRKSPHTFAVALRARLKDAGVDVATQKGQKAVREAVVGLGEKDQQDVVAILLADDLPAESGELWTLVLAGMAAVFTKITGRTHNALMIADIMEGRSAVSVTDPLQA